MDVGYFLSVHMSEPQFLADNNLPFYAKFCIVLFGVFSHNPRKFSCLQLQHAQVNRSILIFYFL